MEKVKVTFFLESGEETRESLKEGFDAVFGPEDTMIFLEIGNEKVSILKSLVVDYIFERIEDNSPDIYVRDEDDKVDCFSISNAYY